MSVASVLRLNIVLCCVLAVLVWLGRAIGDAREGARRSQCISNLKQLGLALINYHEVYGCFPPAHVDDPTGKPMHSWRVLILPMLEQSGLYNAYDFSEPWDGPSNRRLIGRMPGIYACPSRYDPSGRAHLTSFVAVTGPGTLFPDVGGVTTSDLTDGAGVTLAITETETMDIPWTEPRDLDARAMSMIINDMKRASISSQHTFGAEAVFADDSIHFLRSGISPAQLSALLTTAGNEGIGRQALRSTR
jgi:hypothetical protein